MYEKKIENEDAKLGLEGSENPALLNFRKE